MNNLLALITLITLTINNCIAQQSEFSTVRFGNIIQVALPKNWAYIDSEIASHLNTSSEAVLSNINIAVPQGNNVVLVAANARDSAGKTKATLRISVRTGQGQEFTQENMKELTAMSPTEIDAALRPLAEDVVKAMLQMPGVKSYKISELRVDTEGSLVCMLSKFEGYYGGRVMISETSVCPIDSRNIKLSTSYEKSLAAIYAPILTNVRRTLSIPSAK